MAAAQRACIHPDDLIGVEAAVAAGLAGGDAFDLAYRVVHPEEGIRHVASRVRVVTDDAGRPARLVGTNRDVTAEREAEAALRASEARQAYLVRLGDVLRPLVDPVQIQAAACRLLGEHLGVDRAYYVEVNEAERYARVEREYLRGDSPSLAGVFRLAEYGWIVPHLQRGETVVVADTTAADIVPEADRAAMAAILIAAHISTPLAKAGALVGALCVTERVPRAWSVADAELVRETAERIWAAVERARAEAALREERAALAGRVAAATAELRAVSGRLVVVQEEERRHLARELHDEIGQQLTGLDLQLGAARGNGEADGSALAEAGAIAREPTARVRELSMDLRPAALDSLGLLPALLWHLACYESRTSVVVDLRHQGLDRRLPPAVEIVAYRLVQEALTNVARHAGVDTATVQLLAADGALFLTVRDGGRGFDPAATPGLGGLGGLRERVALLGGTLDIESAPGAGTIVTAELPLEDGTAPGGAEDGGAA